MKENIFKQGSDKTTIKEGSDYKEKITIVWSKEAFSKQGCKKSVNQALYVWKSFKWEMNYIRPDSPT